MTAVPSWLAASIKPAFSGALTFIAGIHGQYRRLQCAKVSTFYFDGIREGVSEIWPRAHGVAYIIL